MESYSKLLTAIAALVGSVAWPTITVVILLIFKSEIRSGLAKLPSVVDRMKEIKLGAIAAQLDKVADLAKETDSQGTITSAQVSAAARIKVDSRAVDDAALIDQMDRLCIEYDTIRRVMTPGANRTSSMRQILVQMRTLGPSISDHIDRYKSSSSAGRRLAAVAMMQMQPEKADLNWLLDRFRDDQPFVFYHAALALESVSNLGGDNVIKVRRVAEQALSTLRSFKGEPDANSIQVLESLFAT